MRSKDKDKDKGKSKSKDKDKETSNRNNSPESRRDFMRAAAVAVAGMTIPGLLPEVAFGSAASEKSSISKVAIVRSKNPVPEGDEALGVIGKMIDEGLKYVTGSSDPKSFWKKNFKPSEKVSMKLNTVTWKGNPEPQIVAAVVERLVSAGLSRQNIVVWDKDERGMKKAGFKINKSGPDVRCYSGDDYGLMDRAITSGSVTTRYCKILHENDALINIPVLKTHTLSGVTISLKNHYGSFEDPFKYHGNYCDPFIADINAVDIIRKKTRLIICDAVKVLYAAGPEWNGTYAKRMDTLLISLDPVALDAAGLNMIRKLRKEAGGRLPMMPESKHIKTAAAKGLGNADRKFIELKEIVVG